MGLEYLQSITIAMLCHLKWHILTLPTYTQSQIQKLILNDLGKWVMRVLLFDVYLRRKLKRKDLQDRRRWTHTFIVNLWQLITCSHDNTCQMSDSNLVIWVTWVWGQLVPHKTCSGLPTWGSRFIFRQFLRQSKLWKWIQTDKKGKTILEESLSKYDASIEKILICNYVIIKKRNL